MDESQLTDAAAKALSGVRDGRASCCLTLALLFETGQAQKGVGPDVVQATGWHRAGAERGHRPCQTLYASALYSGAGCERDVGEAARWYRVADEAGDGDAAYALGCMALLGDGGLPRPDVAEAARCFARADKAGCAFARYPLALMYSAGKGVPMDLAEAERLLTLARLKGVDVREPFPGLEDLQPPSAAHGTVHVK